jgi:hypothetical protein
VSDSKAKTQPPSEQVYRKVSPGLWEDAKFKSWGPVPRSPHTLLLWLLTGPTLRSLPGIAPVGRSSMIERIKWPEAEFDKCMAVLVKDRIVIVDYEAPILWLPNAIRYNAPNSSKNVAAWGSQWRDVPECELKDAIWRHLLACCEFFDKTKSKSGDSFVTAFRKACHRPEMFDSALPEPPVFSSNMRGFDGHPDGHQEKTGSTETEKEQDKEQEDSPPARGRSSLPSNVTPLDCRSGGWT